MTQSHGFELLRDEYIEELNTRARIWRHAKSGARLLSLENDDENKVFGITFRTPPADSTGLPHILEHSVLGGSEKYPLKEPFIELVKGSLNTFLNAMTFPDKTAYPVASTNLKDFYNLIDVYLDAVFHPLLTPHHLQQEGWHYELETAAAPLVYKGVVFNEMKGAYSSPDSVLFRHSQHSLFPDNTYGFDSGGDPAVIPDLTYEQFKAFHETYYHPSNAFIFFYGDDDPEERLEILNEYLNDYSAQPTDSAVTLQQSFAGPQRLTFPYSVDSADGADANGQLKAYVMMNWVLPEFEDPALTMGLTVLSYALVETPASPLRKALIDSGLGEDVIGGGLATYTRQMTFSAGLKGVDPANTGRVEALILETLERLAAEGFEDDMVEAAMNTIEFTLRENNTGRYPRGLSLMVRSLDTWLHDRDPLLPLAYEAPLNATKERLAADAGYLQTLIQRYLLDNNHRTTVILEPDAEHARRLEAAEKERLAQAQSAMNQDDLQAVVENTLELKRRQGTPDPPEEVAKLPRLMLADLDREHKPIPLEVGELAGSKVLYHDLFTNGIVYLDVGFDLQGLPQEYLPYVPLLGRAFVDMGTEREDFVKLNQRIGRKTGGIWPTTLTSALQGSDEIATWLFLRAKATTGQVEEMLAILQDVLLMVQLDNQERFRQIVLETKAGEEAGLIPGGHGVVNGRLRAHFNTADWVSEQMGGIEYLLFLRRLAEEIESDWPAVVERLEAVRRLLVRRPNMITNVTLDQDNYTAFAPQLAGFLSALPMETAGKSTWTLPDMPENEGLSIPAQVNYVGKGANLYELGYTLHGSISVIANHLRTSYLWEKIRVQGGAYGGFCAFDRKSGVFSYLSYRDPNLVETLTSYDGTPDFLRRLEVSDDDLTRSIIGAIGAIDAYLLPDAKGFTSLTRYLTGDSDETLQQYRDEVLATTAADFHQLADALDAVRDQGQVVVMGSPDALAAANQQRGWLQITKVL
jgi:Zn-dependent M16 (insulinase) family peptidase